MGKRGEQPWSREKLPLGTVRIRRRSRRGQTVRMIKVRDHGPISGRWIALARHWWLEHKGPIPPGMRVVHYDGDLLNDNPDNYRLATADDVLMLSRAWDPTLDARSHRLAARAAAQSNRDRSRVERMRRLFSGLWYAVDPARLILVNEPFRSRVGVIRRHFNPPAVAGNGKGLEAACLGWPSLSGLQAEILAALAEGDPVTLATIRGRVGRMRWLHGWGGNPREPAYYSSMSGLHSRGWIESRRSLSRGRKQYSIAPSAATARGPVCRVVALRGRDVLERFPRVRRVWPEQVADAA